MECEYILYSAFKSTYFSEETHPGLTLSKWYKNDIGLQ